MWLFAVLTVLLWGTSDVIFKNVSNKGHADELKLLALNGTVYGLVCMGYWAITRTEINWSVLVKYLPIAAIYITSMLFYYKMLPHIKISIASPIANTSCLLTTVLCIVVLKQAVTPVQAVAILMIVSALVVLSFDKSERTQKTGVRNYLIGIGCAMVYFVLDGVGSFLDDAILSDPSKANDQAAVEFANKIFGSTLGEGEAIIAYGIFYLLVGVVVLIIAARKYGKREAFDFRFALNPQILAGCLIETAGQFTYIFAYAQGNAAIFSPFIACFSMVSLILSHIFLRERLRLKQYILIAVMLAGMFMVSIE